MSPETLPKRKADFIEPMDCAQVPHLPDGSQWLFEIKLDDYRAIAVKADGCVNLFSRRRKSFDHQYPHIVEALGELLKTRSGPDGNQAANLTKSWNGHERDSLNAQPRRATQHGKHRGSSK